MYTVQLTVSKFRLKIQLSTTNIGQNVFLQCTYGETLRGTNGFHISKEFSLQQKRIDVRNKFFKFYI